jgi:hypothetical protein
LRFAEMTNARGSLPVYSLKRGATLAAWQAAQPVAAVEHFAVVGDDILVEAVLADIVDQLVEFGAPDEGEDVGEGVGFGWF